MSATTIKAALIDEIDGLAELGLVEGRYGRQAGLPWEDEVNGVKALGVVTWVRQELNPDMPETLGARCWQYTYNVQVFLPMDFELNTEARFDGILEDVLDELGPDPALSVCATTEPPRLVTNDYVMYGALRGEVLCHKGVIEFKASEWIAN